MGGGITSAVGDELGGTKDWKGQQNDGGIEMGLGAGGGLCTKEAVW